MNENLSWNDPVRYISEVLRQQEIEQYNTNKNIVRQLLIKHNAEDLIPMLLED
jgi:hypothetical protein